MLTEEELWEQEVEDVVKGINSEKYSSVRDAARKTGISRTTLGERRKGRTTRRKAQEA